MIVYLPVKSPVTYQNILTVYKLTESCTEIKKKEKTIKACIRYDQV